MLIKRSALVLGIISLSFSGLVAFAQNNPNQMGQNNNPPMGNQMGERGPGGRMWEDLNLTPEQEQKLAAIHTKYHPQMMELHESLRTAKEELKSMWAGSATNAELEAKHQEVSNLHQQMGHLRFQCWLEMREVFTPEQRQQIAAKKGPGMGHGQMNHGPGMGGGQMNPGPGMDNGPMNQGQPGPEEMLDF